MSFTHWLSNRMGLAPRTVSKRRAQPAWRTFRPCLECLEERRVPTTLAVTSSDDLVTEHHTLRWAVANAQSGDTILLTPAIQGKQITLTKGELLLGQQGLTIKSVGNAPVTISGGGISRVFEVATGASVTLSDLIVTGGNGQTGNPFDAHEGRGGGIVVDEGAALTITGSIVTDNAAPVIPITGKGGLGGGIADYGTLTVSKSTVSHNHALGTYGGGIAVFSGVPFSVPFSATLTISDSTVRDNTALQNGGGIAGVSSTVALNNCSVTGNSVTRFDGGGLNNHGGTFTVRHSVVANNAANHNNYGGGIENSFGSTFMLSDSEVSGNSAAYGGGIDNSGMFLVKSDCHLSGNHAVFGGGINNSGTLTVRDSSLSGNSATSDYGQGGGIGNGGTLTVIDSNLSGNTAVSSGGGISSYGTLTVSHSTLSGNSAGTGGYGAGGGIDIEDGTLTVENSSTISGNTASDGGGIFNYGTTTVSGSTLSGNTASQGGGISNYAILTVQDSSHITGNTAEQGGGIANYYGTVTVSDSTLTGNVASMQGGGIWNYGYSNVTVKNSSSITGNSASQGGGIFNYFGAVTVSGSTLTGNVASSQGGGIFNYGFNYGGYIYGGTVTVQDSSSVTGNTAPAGFGADVYNQGVLYLDGTSTIGILDGNPAIPI